MPKSDAITMSNLKAATNISDNRLSAHHPSGAGSQTKLGDFIIQSLESRLTYSDTIFKHMCKSWNVRGNRKEGSYNTSGALPDWEYNDGTLNLIGVNDTFSFFIEVVWGPNTGEHFRKQIGTLKQYWSISTNNCTVNNLQGVHDSVNNQYGIEVVCELTEGGQKTEIIMPYEAPFNPGISKKGENFAFRTTHIASGTGYNVNIIATDIYSGEIRLSYDITDGTPNYNYDIQRKLDGAPDSDYSSITSGTHKNDVTDETYSDTNVTIGNTYRYRIQVTDDGGKGTDEEDETNAITHQN